MAELWTSAYRGRVQGRGQHAAHPGMGLGARLARSESARLVRGRGEHPQPMAVGIECDEGVPEVQLGWRLRHGQAARAPVAMFGAYCFGVAHGERQLAATEASRSRGLDRVLRPQAEHYA